MSRLVYLTDAYKKILATEVVDSGVKGNQFWVILKETIFYPEGGGQPSDQGIIKGFGGNFEVTQVTYNEGKPLHFGKVGVQFKQGEKVDIEINWPRRYRNMQVHSAGHVIHEAVKGLAPEVEPLEGEHGKYPYIKYKGIVDQLLKEQIQLKSNEIISQNLEITSRFVSREELAKILTKVPDYLPTNKQLRIIQLGNFPPTPDGGTQVKTTGEVPSISIISINYDESGDSTVSYAVSRDESKVVASTSKNEEIIPEFEELKSEARQLLKQNSDLESIRLRVLGKRGLLNDTFKKVLESGKYDKAAIGRAFNQLKSEIDLEFQRETVTIPPTIKSGGRDTTLPGIRPPEGHLHPVTQAIESISSIFEKIGFIRVRYPEVEWDWYAFESLNMLPGHPARDEWETFFVDSPKSKIYGEMVLTPHTSSGQVREMERLKTPPIRMINIAKCYRRQSDISHTPMFHQFEGLVVAEGIAITHLKGTIDYFVKQFFGPKRQSRIRPFHFQFTEPSFEVDVTCDICLGKGCRLCKEGWLELGGAGMVHPTVLKNGGIDPDKYTGFAFGWGVERTYMMRSGIKIDDLRLLYENDIRFLTQF